MRNTFFLKENIYSNIKSKYIKSFDSVIDMSLLSNIKKETENNLYYDCPFDNSHFATRSKEYIDNIEYPHIKSYSPILNCYCCNKKWIINNDVQKIILNEEEKFSMILDKFKNSTYFNKIVSGKDAFVLYTEKGIPPELLDIRDIESFNTLMENHKKKSSVSTSI